MLCSASMSSCTEKLDPKIGVSGATTRCVTDCVSVNKEFVKQHFVLFDETIRLRAALKLCTETKP
jgi:hypothetical protein